MGQCPYKPHQQGEGKNFGLFNDLDTIRVQIRQSVIIMIFERNNPPIPRDKIEDFEDAFNVRLPEDFKQYLEENNGGIIKMGQVIEYENAASQPCRVLLREMCGIVSPGIQLETFSIQDMTLAHEQSLPQNMFIIFTDHSNYSPVVLSAEYEDYGYVYTYDRQAPFHYDSADLIAKSFSELQEKIVDREQELIEEGQAMLRRMIEARKNTNPDSD